MKPIFETCSPRPDVLSLGDLKEEMFAADLRDVMEDNAHPVYADPKLFFEHTHPTDGIKSLLKEALGRLSKKEPANAPILRLQTSFGGGKTHNLIGLYHAAWLGSKAKTYLKPLDTDKLAPGSPVEKIAGLVGSDLDPVNGLDHGDAVT